MEKLSCVIPCYCSEFSIENVVTRLIDTIEKDGRYDYEIICVNDYSKDNTISVLRRLGENSTKIKVLNLSRNFGQHSALMAGFRVAIGDVIVCLDDDGENPPEELFKLIDKLNEGYDLVSAKYESDNRGFIRKIGSKISFSMSRNLIHLPKGIELNSFYVFKKYIRDEIIKYDNAYPFVHGLILRVTRNMANVYLKREGRIAGSSGYSLKKLISLWMNGFTAFSEKPLRIASLVGALFSASGFLFGIYLIIRKLVCPDIAMGYTSLMAMVIFIGGVLLLSLGLIGEYIGRIYISINKAPQYVVKEEINVEENSNSK
ncbi:MAG: glycosyltransferase family 2 protein [Lachnospiraceae bacterium]|nr:glycosyltransferase family 2 protein [Lachnospiraceae bacterium]